MLNAIKWPHKVIRLLGNQNVEYQSIRITGSESGKDKFFLITWYPDNHYLIT